MAPVEQIESSTARQLIPSLSLLLQDAVHGGASVGFLAPLSTEDAERYWEKVAQEVQEQTRVLLAVRQGDEILGAVQLALATPPNGRHRAEVQKLLVHTAHRRQGVARALMTALELAAREAGRTLLVLDTAAAGASKLYLSLGYQNVGTIPHYALNTDGQPEATRLFYRLLD